MSYAPPNIKAILTRLKSTYGNEFFNSLTRELHQLIKADYTFIARLDRKQNISRTISIMAGNQLAENFEYSLEHTPCEDVSNDNVCIYPEKITTQFPDDQLLTDMEIEGYVGTPLHDSSGDVMGLIVALFKSKIDAPESITDLFELFSGRISAEIERNDKESELRELNNTLEHKVAQRTKDLSDALNKLHDTQQQIIEQEKLASLGKLVAGVAHEINTPLGIAILGNSTMVSSIKKLQNQFANNTLSRSSLEQIISDLNEASQSLEFNLSRAAELVASFKQMATDFHLDECVEIELSDWLHKVTTNLKPLLKKTGIAMCVHTPEGLSPCKTFPSKLTQVVTNIVSNSVTHAFPQEISFDAPKIDVSLERTDNNYYLEVKDNGIGMDAKTAAHILEPFFTTKRSAGGTGLGMSIVNNLIVGPLQGKMEIESQENAGTRVRIEIPVKLTLPNKQRT